MSHDSPEMNDQITESYQGFPGDSVVKNLLASTEDARYVCLIPVSGKYPGVENGNLFRILAWKIP